ncbi:MAG: hypothetical protein COW71_11915 [Ignavibacteriales bacterium CG18_big_fil_WC_8_21_14_2_50_31_20]|nr:MAG: hypothetical protein COW71_11915 [Ignavibacteriales bacterium CG18_big_fil_WC_8_21_14_2_50_31_20]
MKILIKIIAVLAAIIGIMAVITGSRVLLGLFDPGYQYFTVLVSYNVIMGFVSIVAGILIWKDSAKYKPLTYFITSAHIIVFLLLIIVFSDVISDHSISAMTFRSVAWIIFSLIVWKSKSVMDKT